MNDSETIAAVLTPPGRGALATITLQGARAREIAESCLDRPVAAADYVARPWLRQFQGLAGAAEELVVAFPAADEARLHCHGGPAACEAILRAVESRGARRVVWQNFADSARIALSRALTEPAALVLLDQLQGAWNAELIAIANLLGDADQKKAADERIATLLRRAPFGLHLTEPWQVVIAGRPNAGKSSLLNALLGYQRAITSPRPGTTRDVVTARTALGGWPVEFRDTAGLRETSDPLESTGVERAHSAIHTADLVVYLIPADELAAEVETQLAELQTRAGRWLVIQSKSDLATELPPHNIQLSVSAANGTGLEVLNNAMVDQLIGNPPPPGSAVPWLPQQIETLQQVQQWIAAETAIARTAAVGAIQSLALVPADN